MQWENSGKKQHKRNRRQTLKKWRLLKLSKGWKNLHKNRETSSPKSQVPELAVLGDQILALLAGLSTFLVRELIVHAREIPLKRERSLNKNSQLGWEEERHSMLTWSWTNLVIWISRTSNPFKRCQRNWRTLSRAPKGSSLLFLDLLKQQSRGMIEPRHKRVFP